MSSGIDDAVAVSGAHRPGMNTMSGSTTIQSVILAAGLGTRMRSETIKVLHDILGKPMIEHVVEAALDSGSSKVISVLGHQRERVEDCLRERDYADQLDFAVQSEQQGTAHAVWAARDAIDRDIDYTAILCGDVPNMDGAALSQFFEATVDSGADVGLVTAIVDDPAQYGRIVRGDSGRVEAIVEYADATDEQRAIDEINAGIYLVRTSMLMDALAQIMGDEPDNAQGEYYLTDLIEYGAREGGVFGWAVDNPEMIQGVNNRADLAAATDFARRRINHGWMLDGVTFVDPDNTVVEPGVELARDTTLYPGVVLQGDTTIDSGTVVESGCVVKDCQIGADVHLKANSYLTEARVDDGSNIGPSAHLRPGADIGKDCKVGNFVEVKKARLDDGAKAGHLTYLGDADIGPGANIGAGTITCNYDGEKKSKTTIGAGAFIGSNASLVAPVNIGERAYVGAGSVITDDVDDRCLGVARGRQRIIENWVPNEE